MPLAQILDDFKAAVAQCDGLIGNAHIIDAAGAPLFSVIDRQQITIAAYLNMFIAWETFLEASLADLMVGGATISGTAPIRYISPLNLDAARQLVIGVRKHFDYGNHDYVRADPRTC